MDSREVERALLNRCAAVAKGELAYADDQREANVFRLASMILRSELPAEAARLMAASNMYFQVHPADRVASETILKNGWVMSLPRLRSMLTMLLVRR